MAEKYPLVLNGTNIEELQSGDSIAGAIDSVSEDTSPNLGGNLTTGSYNVSFGDNAKALFGASNDLQIYHDGLNSYIKDSGTGDVFVQVGTRLIVEDVTDGSNIFLGNADAETSLFYAGSKKLETTSTGISVTGNVTATSFTGDGSNLTGINTDLVDDTTPQLGGNLDLNSNDITGTGNIDITGNATISATAPVLKVSTTSGGTAELNLHRVADNDVYTDWKVRNEGGAFYLRKDNTANDDYAMIRGDSGIELYYDNSKKIETTSTGVTVTGTCTATAFSGDGSALTGINSDAFEEVFVGYDSNDIVAQSGWKTITFATINVNENSRWNNSGGSYTIPSAGYYYICFNHMHTNGTHTVYQTRIYNNNKGELAHNYPRDGQATSTSVVAYCTTGDNISFQVYHDNTSHQDENSGRVINACVYKFIGL